MSPRAGQQTEVASDADRTATLQLIIALGRALQALERAVGPHLVQQGLSLTEFAVLEVLYHKGLCGSARSGIAFSSPARARPMSSRNSRSEG